MTFEELRNRICLDSHIEVLDNDGYTLQSGNNSETMWEDVLLDKDIYYIVPGISTKIILEREIR